MSMKSDTERPSAAAGAYPPEPELLPSETLREGRYEVRFARTPEELDAVLRLRFEIFNVELGEGFESSYRTGRDEDEFDAVCHHLIVVEVETGTIVGSYRMQTSEMAARHLGFYSDQLFDLSALSDDVRAASFEIGRACVAKTHRSTQVLFLLWKGLAIYVTANRKRFLFGCASLTSQDPAEGKALFDRLVAGGHRHPEVVVPPRSGYECFGPGFEAPPGVRPKLPTLFRTYLRHGARICGPPAIDREFGTIDYLVIFDVEAMDRRMVRTFFGG